MDKNGGTPPCRVFLRKSLAVPGDELKWAKHRSFYEITNRSFGVKQIGGYWGWGF